MNTLAYCRKSTESEDRQVLSIDSQMAELQRLAERDGVVISKIFTESKSAKASGRSTFNEMLLLIRKKKDCVLYVWKPDRIARNMADAGLVIELMDQGLLKEIRTPEKTFRKTADDLFMLGLDFGISKKYVDDMSVNILRGIKAKLESGVWHNHAPVGYLNHETNKTKTVIVDPVSSPFIKIIFERYASDAYNLRTLSKKMYEDGFRSKTGKRVNTAGIRRILMNPFYYGVMMSNGKSYQGTTHSSYLAGIVRSGKRRSERQKQKQAAEAQLSTQRIYDLCELWDVL